MPVPPDDPFAELLAGWCGKPWMPTRRIGAFLWCPSCHASQQTHDIGVARAAVDARHAEEIAIKDEKLAAYKQAMGGLVLRGVASGTSGEHHPARAACRPCR